MTSLTCCSDVSLATGESRKSTDKPGNPPRSELPRPEPRPLPRPEPRREHRSRDEYRGRDTERSRDNQERRDRKRSRSREWIDDRAAKRAHIERVTVNCSVLYDTPLLRCGAELKFQSYSLMH